MLPLLDPKLDIVFKLLLLREERLLRSMIESVLLPPAPIASLKVINPALPRDFSDDKAAVLDVLVELDNGQSVDIEMQMRRTPALAERIVYYAARVYVGQLRSGQDHRSLRPSVSLVWSGETLFAGTPFHGKFALREE